jgi:hypothetical protein
MPAAIFASPENNISSFLLAWIKALLLIGYDKKEWPSLGNQLYASIKVMMRRYQVSTSQ